MAYAAEREVSKSDLFSFIFDLPQSDIPWG
jgi:hypothetical protein